MLQPAAKIRMKMKTSMADDAPTVDAPPNALATVDASQTSVGEPPNASATAATPSKASTKAVASKTSATAGAPPKALAKVAALKASATADAAFTSNAFNDAAAASKELTTVNAREHEGCTLVCAEGVLASFSEGISRIPLNQLGISWLNRPVSGGHSHNIGRRIVSVEGFVRFRYKNGICHRGDPSDPMRIAKRTNDIAKRDPLLAPVPMAVLLGCCAKSHLLSFLQALKSGTVYWDDTGDLMVPPPAHHCLIEHLDKGMFFEVLKWEAVGKHEEAVRMLISRDNCDASSALAETEIQFLSAMRR